MYSVTDSEAVKAFQGRVMTWWCVSKRDLPWRRNPTPYHVLISEVMLQQTQVNRVIPKYHEFLKEFPTIEDLAVADTKRLLQVWSGLGYNRRALWLREAAQEIVKKGRFPETVEELKTLKGIGPYTSRSILIFAFNRDIATVDTNIRRVFIAAGFADETMSPRQLQEIADALLLRGRSSDWHNALMDYGSLVLTSSSTGVTPVSKQPPFRGSTREIRGAVIRLLTETRSLTPDCIASRLEDEGVETTYLQSVLDQLIGEGMVTCTGEGEFRIAE